MTSRSLICFSLFTAAALQGASLAGTVVLRDSRDEAVTKQKDYSGVVVSAVPVNGVMPQKSKTFTPHVLPVTTGATVDFPNADPIFHNAFSSYSGQIFDVGLYPPATTKSVRFNRPGVVRVFCNIHPTMSAIILVLNTHYFPTTSQTLAGLSLRIVAGEQPTRLPAIAVSEAGYLLAAHKNKYGHDYDSSPDDQTLYPSVRK